MPMERREDGATPAPDMLDVWQEETDLVEAQTYGLYLRDGETRGLASLGKLEAAFEKVRREALETKVGKVPAVWSVYNMGYVVRTPAALFSIDLVHRRDVELAPHLDFALITHNHPDHFREPFYQAMDGAGKTVVSNFLDNFGVRDRRADGGFTRARKTFRIKDVEIRTSLVDHNGYLIDFTTAFEIRVGDWTLYHSGDCGNADKLGTTWGRPDLWTFFPGCGIDVAAAMRRVQPKKVVFGHLWELGHAKSRLTTPMIRAALNAAKPLSPDTTAALWGERIS